MHPKNQSVLGVLFRIESVRSAKTPYRGMGRSVGGWGWGWSFQYSIRIFFKYLNMYYVRTGVLQLVLNLWGMINLIEP